MTSKEKARKCARIAYGKKATDIVVSCVRDLISITDYFVVCTATNRRQMKAIANATRTTLKEMDIRPLGVEGEKEGRWLLMDYDDVILHVFEPEAREYYALEMLWGDAPTVEWEAQ